VADVDDLYRLLPGEFVAARDAKAAELRGAGDRAGAAAVKALRRPSLAAWLVNWLAHERAEDLGRLLEVGAALRDAQEHLAADAMRQLSRQRHQVVAAVATSAYQAATDAGLAVSDQAKRELEATLNAGLVDAGAAAELQAGHLTAALDGTGFGPGQAGTVAKPSSPPPAPPAPPAPSDHDEEAKLEEHRRRLEAAEQATRAADSGVEAARAAADDHQRVRAELDAKSDELALSLKDLQQQLAATTTARDAAADEVRRAEDDVREAEARAVAARAELEQVRDAG
jgi:DNA repair exonuclease SbcCD ATPase subunit